MKINVKYIESEYKALWWISALDNKFTEVVDWTEV